MSARLGPGAEFDLIRRFLQGAGAVDGVVVGPGDDCAVLDLAPLAVSVDMSLEDVHFRRDWMSAREIGGRAAAAALSDLAAMAARPVGVLVSLAAPESDVPDYAAELVAGAAEAARTVGAELIGGDVARSPDRLAIDVVVLGHAPAPVRRDGARPGDELWVTGRLGGAAAAVAALLEGGEPNRAARERMVRPRPRTAEAVWLAQRVALHAAIDVSDGLAGDARHVAAASGVRVELEPARVPVDSDAGANLELALGGGEDYELCLAAEPGALDAVRDDFVAGFGVELTRVGAVREGEGVWLVDGDGRAAAAPRGGWVHFERDVGAADVDRLDREE